MSGLKLTPNSVLHFDANSIRQHLENVREELVVVEREGSDGFEIGVGRGAPSSEHQGVSVTGILPPLYPEWLGDRSFQEAHGTRFAYVAGAMANGIATVEIVVSMAKHGMLGFFGSAGLTLPVVESAIARLQNEVPEGKAFGMNLIHSPHEKELEQGIVDLYIKHGIRRVSASAYMGLTEMVVQYAVHGLYEEDGIVQRQNYLFAKISRPEVARRFMSPPPADLLESLLSKGRITEAEAALAARVPLCADITVEADSGGHTDNQTLTAVFPSVARARDEVMAAHDFQTPIRLGAAGGLGTPSSLAAAFALGASYVVTGSVNQSCVESGLSEKGKDLLCEAQLGDVMMAPAADMFEMGVKVQVLKKGAMFGVRAQKLYDIYKSHNALSELADDTREMLERSFFKSTLEEVWKGCERFFAARDPRELEKAAKSEKHKMALIFRWYLGQSSRWAIKGDALRTLDFQIWCGPAMGAFNAWVQGSFLEAASSREVGQVALNLLEGAAVITRAQQLRSFGANVPSSAFYFAPRPMAALA